MDSLQNTSKIPECSFSVYTNIISSMQLDQTREGEIKNLRKEMQARDQTIKEAVERIKKLEERLAQLAPAEGS